MIPDFLRRQPEWIEPEHRDYMNRARYSYAFSKHEAIILNKGTRWAEPLGIVRLEDYAAAYWKRLDEEATHDR